VVRNHKLEYDPPLEELRLQHLTAHLQPFLALPLRMKGVSSLSERAGFFGGIAHAYPAATAKVVRTPYARWYPVHTWFA
jgi:dynein heavy chain 2